MAYPDAHRYRIGVNYESLLVNKCPYSVNKYHRDGSMRSDGNSGSAPNYRPNSFDDLTEEENYKGIPFELDSNTAGYFVRNENDDDHYTQPDNLFKLMTLEQKSNTISNTIGAMNRISGPKKDTIINRQLCHWFRADSELGREASKGLGVEVDIKLLR